MNLKITQIKKINKVFFITIFITLIISPIFAQTNITYNINGFCKNQEITITFYNKSQYDNRKEIQRDLCTYNENSKDDNCKEFDKIELEATLYNGPDDRFDYLKSFNLYGNIKQIKYTFDKSNDYLLQIKPDNDQIRDFEILIPIEECKTYNENLEKKKLEKELKLQEQKEIEEIEKQKEIEELNNNQKVQNSTHIKNLSIEEKILKDNPGFILRNLEIFQTATLVKGFSKFDKIRIFGISLIFIIVLFRLYKLKKEHDKVLK